jgi:hypothetical protein
VDLFLYDTGFLGFQAIPDLGLFLGSWMVVGFRRIWINGVFQGLDWFFRGSGFSGS